MPLEQVKRARQSVARQFGYVVLDKYCNAISVRELHGWIASLQICGFFELNTAKLIIGSAYDDKAAREDS